MSASRFNISQWFIGCAFAIATGMPQSVAAADPVPDFVCGFEVDARSIALAKMLSGVWEANDYFDKNDFSVLRLIVFEHSSIVMDGDDREVLSDYRSNSIKRFKKGASRDTAREIVVDKEEFWSRVFYVDYKIKSQQYIFVQSVDLSVMHAWWSSSKKKCRE